jgi:transposase-like protein
VGEAVQGGGGSRPIGRRANDRFDAHQGAPLGSGRKRGAQRQAIGRSRIGVGVNSAGRREVLGLAIGTSEAETFWTDFLRKLAQRRPRGVKLVISDAHQGIKAAVSKVLNASWQCCRVHFMRNVLARAGKQGRRVVSAFIGTAFAQDAGAARTQWRQVADQLRPRVLKLATLMDEAETDVVAYMTFLPRIGRSRTRRIPSSA